jgi:dipeptide/tripeptide permease
MDLAKGPSRDRMAERKGHPPGLYALFFTEMWERLAFYTMVGILLLYTTDTERGGLGMSAGEGNEIYGLYLAFVYFTPFIGGMIADRFLGYRRAVLVGAVCMSSGLFLMSVPGKSYFLFGLLGLIIGNGFFKPNISVMVGNLYQAGDPKRDAGFNIFYMGINIGAFVANLMAAGVRNEWGWLLTFRVAGVGLVISMIILLTQWKRLEAADRQPEKKPGDAGLGSVFGKILLPAAVFGAAGYFLAKWMGTQGMLPAGMRPAIVGFLLGALPVIYFFVKLIRDAPPKERRGLQALLPIYVAGGTFFMILHLNGSAMTQWARDQTNREAPAATPSFWQQEALPNYYLTAGEDTPRPHPDSLATTESDAYARMFGQQRLDQPAIDGILGENADLEPFAVPSSDDTEKVEEVIGNRAVNVYEDGVVKVSEGEDSHGAKVVNVEVPEGAKPKGRVAFTRDVEGKKIGVFVVSKAVYDKLYDGYHERFGHEPETMKPGSYLPTINAEVYQSLNALFVIAFTPLLVGFFAMWARRGKPITTAQKLFYGMVLTTCSLLFMALSGLMSDGGAERVSALWLGGFYAIVTLGELCLSPMGLSLVTKLSPQRLVGLTMGGWFLATAFGNNFSGFFGGIQGQMSPVSFFLLLAGLAGAVAVYLRIALPKLDKVIKEYAG